jgi:hypothetical protein
MKKYEASIFIKDILKLFNLTITSKNYENLCVGCDRNVFYYIANQKVKHMNEIVEEAIKQLIKNEIRQKEKKDKFIFYIKDHITGIDNVLKDGDNNKIIEYVVSKFINKQEIKKTHISTNQIIESYIKGLIYLHRDFKLSRILIQNTVDLLIKDIILREDLKLYGDNQKTINYLLYKRVVPQKILTTIEFMNKLIILNPDNDSKDFIASQLKFILKWYFEYYLKKSFIEIEQKANARFFKENGKVKVYTLLELINKGWTLEKFAGEMLNLFHKTINNLADDNTSTIQEMIEIIGNQPDSRRLLLNERNEAIGCWSLNPLFKEDFIRDTKGNFYVSELINDTVPILMQGTFDIHFGVICLIEEYRNTSTFNKLLFSIVKFIEELALNDVFLDGICTQTYTPHGRVLAKSIGLKYCCQHEDGHGQVYCGNIRDLLNKPFLRDYNVLKSLYKNQFA